VHVSLWKNSCRVQVRFAVSCRSVPQLPWPSTRKRKPRKQKTRKQKNPFARTGAATSVFFRSLPWQSLCTDARRSSKDGTASMPRVRWLLRRRTGGARHWWGSCCLHQYTVSCRGFEAPTWELSREQKQRCIRLWPSDELLGDVALSAFFEVDAVPTRSAHDDRIRRTPREVQLYPRKH
jgi:hypothetical protein